MFEVFAAAPTAWLTNAEAARLAQVATRTARQYTTRFVAQGMLERAGTFPGLRFRLTPKARKGRGVAAALRRAGEVFRGE